MNNVKKTCAGLDCPERRCTVCRISPSLHRDINSHPFQGGECNAEVDANYFEVISHHCLRCHKDSKDLNHSCTGEITNCGKLTGGDCMAGEDTKTCENGHTMIGIGFYRCPECEARWKLKQEIKCDGKCAPDECVCPSQPEIEGWWEKEYWEKYGGLATHPLANGLKSFISSLLLRDREAVVREIEKLEKEITWDNGECSSCGYESLYEGVPHGCASYNQALSDILSILQAKEKKQI